MKTTLAIIALGATLLSCQPAHAQSSTVVASSGAFACASKDYYRRAIRFLVDGDRAAFGRHLASGYMSGQCVTFKYGERVYVDDVELFTGLTQVRRAGETHSFWLSSEAVR